MSDSDPSANSPDDLASDGWKPPPTPQLRTDHLTVLRLAAQGKYPDLTRTRYRMALSECQRWNLVRTSAAALTPAGEAALARAKERR